MDPPFDAPKWLKVVTAEDRPDLWEAVEAQHLFRDLWPEYNHHGNHAESLFGTLVPAHARFQVLFLDQRVDQVVARGRTIAFRWNGSLDDLPRGIDALGIRALSDSAAPSALSALAAEVDLGYQRSGVSALLIKTMRALAQLHGLAPLVAPVRPSWKVRYPLMPIERYAEWRRDDGFLFDPWLRTHERLGGRVLRGAPRSLHISASVPDWERWTDLKFPVDGSYVFDGGLAPLEVSDGGGTYFEPNVWMIHEV